MISFESHTITSSRHGENQQLCLCMLQLQRIISRFRIWYMNTFVKSLISLFFFNCINGVNSQLCWSRKKCRAPFPGRFDICPCGEKSPCSACPLRTPISLSPEHGRGPCHKTHLPAGSTALPALWFAVKRETFREGTEREERWPQRARSSGGKVDKRERE